MIAFDLNQNDSEALRHHVESFNRNSGDAREDARLRVALQELRAALVAHLEDPGMVGSCTVPDHLFASALTSRLHWM